MCPEKRNTIPRVGTFEGALEALHVVDVSSDDLSPQLGQFFRLVGVDVARKGAGGEATAGVAQDGLNQAAALRAGCSYDCNDLLFSHMILLVKLKWNASGWSSNPRGGFALQRLTVLGVRTCYKVALAPVTVPGAPCQGTLRASCATASFATRRLSLAR